MPAKSRYTPIEMGANAKSCPSGVNGMSGVTSTIRSVATSRYGLGMLRMNGRRVRMTKHHEGGGDDRRDEPSRSQQGWPGVHEQ